MKKLIITPLLILFLFSSVAFLSISAFGQGRGDGFTASVDTIMYEGFNYPAGQLPPGWILDGAQAPWSVNNSLMAGGSAPELYLGYSFASGSSRLISPAINIENIHELCLKYKQYLINYQADYGEIIGLDVTFDGGQTWQAVWEQPLGLLDIPQGEFEYYLSVPEGATSMQYAFRYEGNSYAINMWVIDNIILETVPDNDLLCTSYCHFDGNTTPKAGEMTMYFAEILNGGKQTQTNYTVKLMREDGVELASAPGESIAYGEKKFYLLQCTPGAEYIGNPTNVYVYIDFAQDEIPENNHSKNLMINVQPVNTATTQIGSGSWPMIYLPYNFFNLYSLTQSLYFPEEIGMTGDSITGIQYTCQFDEDVPNIPIQIWMGETNKHNLSEGWIDPATLTPVFNGTVNFAKGFNNIYIPLDNAYEYHGGNLVVYSNKGYTKMVIGTPFISSIDTGSNRSYASERDDAAFDPMNPPTGYSTDYYPNITLFYSTSPNSITDIQKSASAISLFPNPANSILSVRADEIVLEIKMFNTLGQVVYQKTVGNKQHEINVSNFNPGVYLVQMLTPKGLITQKVQVAK